MYIALYQLPLTFPPFILPISLFPPHRRRDKAKPPTPHPPWYFSTYGASIILNPTQRQPVSDSAAEQSHPDCARREKTFLLPIIRLSFAICNTDPTRFSSTRILLLMIVIILPVFRSLCFFSHLHGLWPWTSYGSVIQRTLSPRELKAQWWIRCITPRWCRGQRKTRRME